MKVELKQIVDQLTETIELQEGQKSISNDR